MGRRLNQIIAVEKGVKERTNRTVTDLYHQGQKSDPFSGFTKTYTPKDENGDKFPPEQKLVQTTAAEVLRSVQRAFSELFDVTAAKDYANCQAFGTVEFDDEILLKDVPVTYLLFLEKQLTDLHTIVAKLPTLSPDERWSWDEAAGLYRSAPVQTIRTAKVKDPIVLYPATKEHPAQTAMVDKDVTMGTWEAIKMSGALKPSVKEQVLNRIEKLQRAIKEAREEANTIAAPDRNVGEKVFYWLFGDVL